MCHWNPKAYDYSSKQTKHPDGRITYEKIGTWVLCIATTEEILNDARKKRTSS